MRVLSSSNARLTGLLGHLCGLYHDGKFRLKARIGKSIGIQQVLLNCFLSLTSNIEPFVSNWRDILSENKQLTKTVDD